MLFCSKFNRLSSSERILKIG